MALNSRDKGKRGERELCKKLSDIFGGSFVRVPNSGAAVGGSNSKRRDLLSDTQSKVFRGDIIPPDHLAKFFLEAKAYQVFPFHQLLQPGPCLLLDEWIEQAMTGIDPGDQWFVAFKINRLGWFVAVPEAECCDYKFDNHCTYTGAYGMFRVTDLIKFFRSNREAILAKAGENDRSIAGNLASTPCAAVNCNP